MLRFSFLDRRMWRPWKGHVTSPFFDGRGRKLHRQSTLLALFLGTFERTSDIFPNFPQRHRHRFFFFLGGSPQSARRTVDGPS